ncbi:MAG: hypothetical protein AMXMBFR33_73080 [Candidatus Xenobia bacterium]
MEPWESLRSSGALRSGASVAAAASVTTGPVGPVVTEEVHRQLLAAVDRIERGGATFERRQERFLSFLEPRYLPLTEGAPVCEPDGTVSDLMVTEPGNSRRMVTDLRDLQLLDCQYGAGPEALSPQEQPMLLAATRLHELSTRHWQSPCRQLDRLQRAQPVVLDLPGGAVRVENLDELALMDYLRGSGQGVENLRQPEQARRLKSAREAGLELTLDGRDADPPELYRKPQETLCAARGEGLAVPIEAEELDDLPRLATRLERYEQVFEERILPAHARFGRDHRPRVYPRLLVEKGAGFSLEVTAMVLAELLSRGPERAWEAEPEAEKLAEGLLATASDDLDLALKTLRISRVYSHQGLSQAQQHLAELAGLPQRADLLDAFRRVVAGTRGLEAAVEGLELARIPVAQESMNDRLALFEQLSRCLPPEQRDETTPLYRMILAQRHPSDSLQATGKRFLELRSLTGDEEAREAFRRIQEQAHDPAEADRMVFELAQALLMEQDRKEALARILGQTDLPQSQVETRADSVLVGGVRVRRKLAR